MIAGLWSVKINALLSLINHQPDTDEIYLYAKDPFQVECQLLFNKHEILGVKHCNDSKAFVECSNDMHDIQENIDTKIWRKYEYG